MRPSIRIAHTIAVVSILSLGAGAATAQTTGKVAQQQQAHVSRVEAPGTAELKVAVEQLGQTRVQMTRKLQELTALNASMRTRIVNALKICDDRTTSNADKIDRIRKNFGGVSKDLENQDRLGNFEIQDLMSQYNQAERRASEVLKKYQDTQRGAVQKVN